MTNATSDAQFRFAMSEDGMKLGVSRYIPPSGGEGPSVELLKRQVAEAGVNLPVDENAARQVVDAIQRDGEIKRVVLVRGIDAQEPQNASLVALGNIDFPVFPGDGFARLNPPLEARDGETIDGRFIKPQEHFNPESIDVKVGDNVEVDPLTGEYVSKVWGMARLKSGVISVDPIPRISEDAVEVKGNVHHKDFRGQTVTPERIEKELRDLGVVIDIDLFDLGGKLQHAKTTKEPLFDQTLVAGKHPVPGRDGYLEHLVSTRDDAGSEDDSGRMDFRDRGAYPLVDPGQPIGRLHPPTQGQGGIDIYGKTIPASGGRELRLHLGENVALRPDGITYEAKARGIMVMENNSLSVTNCLVVSGDVDLSTGNIKVEEGSVKVIGSVLAGFSVTAPKHVMITGSVESATIVAGGDVSVSGGVLMPEGGNITAEGNISASFATNANLEAGGDVIIANDVTNCSIQAEGKLFATRGKGHIQGGSIVTAKGMDINEAGSDLGVATALTVRIEHAEDEELRQERVKVKAAIRRIDEALGPDEPRVILERTPPEKRAAMAEVLKHRITLIKRRKAISEQINQLNLARQEELAGIKIRVRRLLNSGVSVKFGSKVLEIDQQTEATSISWDDRIRQIVFSD